MRDVNVKFRDEKSEEKLCESPYIVKSMFEHKFDSSQYGSLFCSRGNYCFRTFAWNNHLVLMSSVQSFKEITSFSASKCASGCGLFSFLSSCSQYRRCCGVNWGCAMVYENNIFLFVGTHCQLEAETGIATTLKKYSNYLVNIALGKNATASSVIESPR